MGLDGGVRDLVRELDVTCHVGKKDFGPMEGTTKGNTNEGP